MTFTTDAATVHFRDRTHARVVVRVGKDGPVVSERNIDGTAMRLDVRPEQSASVLGLHAGCTVAWTLRSGRPGVVVHAWSRELPGHLDEFETFVPRP